MVEEEGEGGGIALYILRPHFVTWVGRVVQIAELARTAVEIWCQSCLASIVAMQSIKSGWGPKEETTNLMSLGGPLYPWGCV